MGHPWFPSPVLSVPWGHVLAAGLGWSPGGVPRVPSCPSLPTPAARGPSASDPPLSSRRPWAPRSSLPRQLIKVSASHGLGPSLGRTGSPLKSVPGSCPPPAPRVQCTRAAFHRPRKHAGPSRPFVTGLSGPAVPRPTTAKGLLLGRLSRCDWAGQRHTRAGVPSRGPHGLAARGRGVFPANPAVPGLRPHLGPSLFQAELISRFLA